MMKTMVLLYAVVAPALVLAVSEVAMTRNGPVEWRAPRDGDLAWASLSDNRTTNGWTFLHVNTSNTVGSDSERAYAAGVVEGLLTRQLIYYNYVNNYGKGDWCTNNAKLCPLLKNYMAKQDAWMQTQRDNAEPHQEAYWHHVFLLSDQLRGLADGYAMNATKGEELDLFAMNLLQMSGDLEDLASALLGPEAPKGVVGSGSCSAMIKLLPGNAELFAAQDTWDNFSGMLRTYKKYTFYFEHAAAVEQTFSSSPGVVGSGDDFYQLSSQLVSMETTIGNNNQTLVELYIQPESVLEWRRSIVANRLAHSGSEWADVFSRHNSGTYNNQWMIVDYSRFVPGAEHLADDLLWVVEQIPGFVRSKDCTDTLRQQSYWASYNIAAFPFIFDMSNQPAQVAKYGDWFTHDKSPRALIFARDHTHITDLTSMQHMMRYNDFQHDPLSRCNCTPTPFSGENAISARSDLNPSDMKAPFGALVRRSHGGTDSKMTNASLMRQGLSTSAVCGPTHGTQSNSAHPLPVFDWATADFPDALHYGQPERFDFDYVHVTW